MSLTDISIEVVSPPDTSETVQRERIVPWVERVSTNKIEGYITVRTIPTSPKIPTY